MDSGAVNESKTIRNQFSEVGENSGNLTFFESVKREIPYTRIINNSIHSEINDKDIVVIPSSNFFMHGGNDSFFKAL